MRMSTRNQLPGTVEPWGQLPSSPVQYERNQSAGRQQAVSAPDAVADGGVQSRIMSRYATTSVCLLNVTQRWVGAVRKQCTGTQ